MRISICLPTCAEVKLRIAMQSRTCFKSRMNRGFCPFDRNCRCAFAIMI